jgi:hypothetical protein
VDPSVDLCRAQLLEEGAVGTTWSRIQPHLGHAQLERLDPATKKMFVGGSPLSALPTIIVGGPRLWATTFEGPSSSPRTYR